MSANTKPASQFNPNRLFFLGAGFSAAAGVPLTSELLDRAMKNLHKECPEMFSMLRSYAQAFFSYGDSEPDFSRVDFADFCTALEYVELRTWGGMKRWSDAGCKELLTFKYYLAKTLVELTPSGEVIPKLYREFARQLRSGDAVVTFNWDCLLEAALRVEGKAYSYNLDKEVKIIKMHGSTNWRLAFADDQVPALNWLPLKAGLVGQTVWSPDLDEISTWRSYDLLGEIQPLLVLPGAGKSREARHLAFLWYQPEGLFFFTGDVYVIGLSLTKDDFLIRAFFMDNMPDLGVNDPDRRVIIINPDPSTRVNYEFILDKKHARFLCEKFDMKHVDAMRQPASQSFSS